MTLLWLLLTFSVFLVLITHRRKRWVEPFLIVLQGLYYLHISLHLLIGYPKEVLAGTSVAETTCAEMDVVQTGHSVYLRAKEECSYSLG